MGKTNLLYVITKLELGGAQKQLLSLIKGLSREDDFSVFLFTAKNGPLMEEARGIPGLRVHASGFLERPVNFLKDAFVLIELVIFIRKYNIQIVHTHSSKAGILGRLGARLAGIKVIIHTVHGWSFNDYQPVFIRRFYVFLERFVARFTSRIVVVSTHDKDKAIAEGIGRPGNYFLIRYGIDFHAAAADTRQIRKELGISADDFVVGNISCFKPQKSLRDFLRLVLLVKERVSREGFSRRVKFVLIGDGSLRSSVEEMADEYGISSQLVLTGWRRDVPVLLDIFDVFVLTSLWEGLPVSVLEAMKASLPVVATDTGGIAEVMSEGKTGFLVRRHDMKGMAEKIVFLLKNEHVRTGIAAYNKNFLGDEFTVGYMIERYRCLYAKKPRGMNRTCSEL